MSKQIEVLDGMVAPIRITSQSEDGKIESDLELGWLGQVGTWTSIVVTETDVETGETGSAHLCATVEDLDMIAAWCTAAADELRTYKTMSDYSYDGN